MRFRPCIDLHDGKVKQIVGATLESGSVAENFVSERSAGDYARLFAADGLSGGHVIMLGKGCEAAASEALAAYPGGLQIGGGIRADNAADFLALGASHVIVTSAAFRDGSLSLDAIAEISAAIGAAHLVLDLSCVPTANGYRVAANRWKTVTDTEVTPAMLARLEPWCDEFLIHAVSVEGRKAGPDLALAALLAAYAKNGKPVTYAGGIATIADLDAFAESSGGAVDYTIGSALDLYGGSLSYTALAARSATGK